MIGCMPGRSLRRAWESGALNQQDRNGDADARYRHHQEATAFSFPGAHQ
jgi:hypothetical protein